MNARCDYSSFLMSAIREGFQTGHEYSSLLLTIVLNSVSMTTLNLSVNSEYNDYPVCHLVGALDNFRDLCRPSDIGTKMNTEIFHFVGWQNILTR